MPSELTIIGFAGRKGSGKDTAARVFEEHGYVHLKMAGGLKCMLHAFLAYQGVQDSVVYRMLEGDLKEIPTEFLGGRSPRYAMQSLGTEWGRNLISEDLWIEAFLNAAFEAQTVVCSDVRFPNEVEAIQSVGGEVIRIDRDTGAVNDNHASEAMIDELEVDAVLSNDAPSAAEFARQVGHIMGPARSRV
jgi:hypothetical protein